MTLDPGDAAHRKCVERGRRMLAALFPNMSPLQWEPRPYGLWRAWQADTSFFLRNQWLYVVLRNEKYLRMAVAAEIIDRYLGDAEAEIRAVADRASG